MFSDIPIYHYDPETQEHIATTMAALDPEEKRRGREIPLVPGCATLKSPLEAPPGMVNVFDIGTDNWALVEDHRGAEYWLPTGEKVVITDLGPVPPELLQGEPAPAIEDIIDQVRGVRTSMLAESDWTQLPDTPLTANERTAWAECRQDLRDAPEFLAGAWETMADAEKVMWRRPTCNMIMDLCGREPWE